MRMANPAVIPRNHLVEFAIKAAVERGDFQPFEEMLSVVSRPYEDRPDLEQTDLEQTDLEHTDLERSKLERYTTPALPGECVRQTFCGT